MTKPCLVILGVPRSGTSAVAGVLHHLGVFMGEQFNRPNNANPKGFFEDLEVVELHNKFLDNGKFPETTILTEDTEKMSSYKEFARKRESLGRVWGFKDRLTPFVFHITKKHIDNLRIITTERPFHESVCSWTTQFNVHVSTAKKDIADALYARDMALSEFAGRVLRVSYHELVNETEKTVKRIARFANVPATKEAIDFIDPKLWRCS